ncbi:MAG: S8 family serine peptidase [Acidobacteriota bacterium]
MLRNVLCCCLLVLVALVPLTSEASGARKVASDHEYLVVFEPGAVKAGEARRLIEEAGGTVQRDHLEIGLMAAHSFDPDFASRLAEHRTVATVQPDLWVLPEDAGFRSPVEAAQVRTITAPDAPDIVGRFQALRRAAGPDQAITVTDPTAAAFFDVLGWSFLPMELPAAWAAGNLGDPEVKVAVLDSGIDYTHIDLDGKVDLDLSRSFVPEDDALLEDLFPGAHPVADLNFHGTVAAGNIACNALGHACVAPNVTLVGIKVVDKDYQSTVGRMIAGILYAGAIRADVVNISYSFFPHLSLDNPEDRWAVRLMKLAILWARLRGAIVLAEAGVDPNMPFREGIDADADGNDRIVPAQAGAVVVSGTSVADAFGNFNNFGFSLVDIAAPGGEFPFADFFTTAVWGPCSSFTTIEAIRFCVDDAPGWVNVAGSIAATANASGVAALIDSQHGGRLRGWQIRRQLFRTADDLGDPGVDPFFGVGRVNARRATSE